MARILLTQGACPVCDDPVPRTVHCIAGLQREVYHCPADGRLEYGPSDVPIAELGLDLPAAGRAQGATGLELVH